jgi:hypothetical protein
MATMASHFSTTSQIRDAFLLGRVEINNEKLKKVKTSNFKVVKGLSVIMEKNSV